MASASYSSLVERAQEIRRAVLAGENTAERVGGLLRDMLEWMRETSASPGERFLSATENDTALGIISFLQGIQFGEMFVPGLAGRGGRIDGAGHGELRSLRLWESLEVPEFRYNRVNIYIGIRVETFGGGIIESVVPNDDNTGTVNLKLEGGEYGAVAVGDLCMGIWHDERPYVAQEGSMDDFDESYTIYENAVSNADDRKGNFSFAGFKTVYFEITGVSGANNNSFTYLLRSSLDGGNGIHPFAGMHFAARGNNVNAERRAFTYSTTEYVLALHNVSTWEFQPENYYYIRGKLDGFSMPAVDAYGNTYQKVFHGEGQVLGNAYIFGQIDTFERQVYRMEIDQSMGGSLAPGETEMVTILVKNGYGEDVTSRFTNISVTRNTGDDATDAVWNAAHTSVTNPFMISFSDLGIDGIHKVMAVFNVVATDEATDETANRQMDYFS